MVNKIKSLMLRNRHNQSIMLQQLKELEWAHVYHDSIRGKEWIMNLSLNIGRWAGNYSFFYVLNRVLFDYKPEKILELGLGESTKFISTYIDNYLLNTRHLVIEQDENWKNLFVENFEVSKYTEIAVCSLKKTIIKGNETNIYNNLNKRIGIEKFDLYVIDGPFGSPHYSRYDIVEIAQNFNIQDQFIIIFDDYNRPGEKETIKDLFIVLKKKNINTFYHNYAGNKSVLVIATKKYRYATTL